MNYQEFYHRMNEFADLMGLGIRHTKKDVFAYVNLFTLNLVRPQFARKILRAFGNLLLFVSLSRISTKSAMWIET